MSYLCTMIIKNSHIGIPLELIGQAFEAKTISRLKVFAVCKMFANDILPLKGSKMDAVIKESGYQRRTVIKHLTNLTQQGWVGFDKTTKTYHIRSWKHLKASKAFTYAEVVIVSTKDIKSFREILLASLIAKKILKQKYYNYSLAIKENKISTGTVKKLRSCGSVKSKAALQAYLSQQPDNGLSYFGLSNKSIGELISLSASRASYIKKRSSVCGYIEINQKFDVLAEFPNRIENLRDFYLKGYGDEKKYIRVRCILKEGKKTYQVLRQLMSEIIPLDISIKTVNMKR